VISTWGRLQPFTLLHMLQFLHEMNKIEQLSSIDMVLRAGADIDAFCCSQIPGEPSKTVLMEAAQYNRSIELLVLLLSRGASVCLQTTPHGDTALHLAARKGYTDKCRLLVGKDPRVLTVKDSRGCAALLAAAHEGHCETVQLLHELGAELSATDAHGDSALGVAAAGNHLPVMAYLLSCGADVNAVSAVTGITPLFSAVSRSSIEAMQLLLERGADLNYRTTKEGFDAVFIAAEVGQVRALQHLVSLGLDCDTLDVRGSSPLMLSATFGHTAAVEYLLSQGADIHRLNVEHCDALRHAATHSKRPELVELLLANGAAVDVRSVNGTTALSATAANGDAASAAVLLAAGSDTAQVSDDGTTCLHRAVMDKHAACVTLLLEHGVAAVIDSLAPFCTCCGPLTALMMCAEPAVLQQLLRAGADVHKTTAAGDTCLHVAAKHKYTAAVLCLLIKAGVDLAAVNSDGLTAAQVARAKGFTLAESLLIRAARDN
jgi:ankyrin repeat protein